MRALHIDTTVNNNEWKYKDLTVEEIKNILGEFNNTVSNYRNSSGLNLLFWYSISCSGLAPIAVWDRIQQQWIFKDVIITGQGVDNISTDLTKKDIKILNNLKVYSGSQSQKYGLPNTISNQSIYQNFDKKFIPCYIDRFYLEV